MAACNAAAFLAKAYRGLTLRKEVGLAVAASATIASGFSFRNSLTIGAKDAPYVSTDEKTKCEVPSITLDWYVEQTGDVPDLIKIDVEGAELFVLLGAERLLKQIQPYLISVSILIGYHSPKRPPIFSICSKSWDTK